MSLLFPKNFKDPVSASYEARDNLAQLMQTDPRGGKDQVTTRTALQCFQRAKDLQPGYLDGVKSWIRSGCVYAAAGTATAGAIGLTGWTMWTLTPEGHRKWLIGGACLTGWISSECGYRPVEYLKALLAVTVRDSANRAANSSVKNDERTWAEKEIEIKECRSEIVKQISAVCNDCSKFLHEMYEQKAENNVDRRLELKQMADRLQKQIPTIEKLFKQLDLTKPQIEKILQQLKDEVLFIQKNACALSTESCGKMNAELLERFAGLGYSIREIAVPLSIQERVSKAKKYQFGILDRCAGYGSALLAGIGTSAAVTVALGLIAAAYDVYQNENIFSSYEKISNLKSAFHHPALGVAALGVAGVGTAVVAHKSFDHEQAVDENAQYVEKELSIAGKDLQTIYDGVANHLRILRTNHNFSMARNLKNEQLAIEKEVQKLQIAHNPLVKFTQALR